MTDISAQAERKARMERWVSEYGDCLLRICCLYLGDSTLAEDAAQDALLKAWRSMDRFEGRNGSSEKTWLVSIAMNTCKNYRRSAWLRHRKDEIPMEDYVAWGKEEDRSLWLDIQRLPDKQKRIVILRWYQGMTVDETASALHIGRSAVWHEQQRALSALRCTLTGRDEHE